MANISNKQFTYNRDCRKWPSIAENGIMSFYHAITSAIFIINSSGSGNLSTPNSLSHLHLVSLFKKPHRIAFFISSRISLFPSLLAIFLIASLTTLRLFPFPFLLYNLLILANVYLISQQFVSTHYDTFRQEVHNWA